MALRGETIGRAYIKILADGSGFDDSIHKMGKDAEPAIEVMGREHEKAYSKSYNDQLQKDKNFEKSYRRQIDQAFGAMSARAKTLSGTLQQRIADAIGEGFDFGVEVPVGISDEDVDRRAQQIGEKAAHNIVVGLNEGMDPKQINFPAEIRKAIRGVTDDMEDDWRRASRDIEQQNRETTRDIRRNFDAAGHSIRESIGAIREFDQEFDHSQRVVRKFHTEVKKAHDELSNVRKGGDDAGKGIRAFADGLGATFGRGSRNNFLNFTGSLIRNMALIPEMFFKVGKGITDAMSGASEATGVISRMGSAFAEATANGEKMGSGIMAMVAELVATGVPGLIALSGAVLLIGGSIGVVTSLVGALGGALIGLASTIGFGLVGVLGGAAAALLPVAAAIGGVALAIHGIGGLKALKDDVKPLKATFDDLSKTVAKSAFANLGDNIDRANEALKGMKPLAHAVGVGLGHMIDGFVQSLNSPAWRQFRNALTTFLPGAMETLGQTIGNVFGGLGGIFRSLITDIGGTKSIGTQFLDTIERLSRKFSEWANSAKGQKSLHDFFTDAWESAQKLGHFISTGIGLIGRLLGAAKPTGDTLFDQMTNKMQEWSDWLSDPANQDSIKEWFGNAVAIATDVGHAIGRLSDAFAKLDNPTNRAIGRILFDSLVIGLGFLNKAIQVVGFSVKVVFGYFQTFLKAVRTVMLVISKVPSPFQGMAKGAVEAIDKFNDTVDAIGKVDKAAKKVKDTKVDFNTAPAIQKMGLVVKKTEDGRRVVRMLDGTKVSLATQKAVLDMQKVWDKTRDAKSKVDALDGNKVQVNTQAAQTSLKFVQTEAEKAESAVKAVDGLYVNVNTSSAQASLNQLSHTADTVNQKLSRGSKATMAAGGLVVGPTHALIGEAGPEAIVPLNRALHMVDPAVRELSAIAQGLTPMARGGVTPGKVTNVGGITVITPTKDPVAVATETVNRLVGVGY